MAKTASTPTRVAADLAASAASVAPTENRTVTEQINYWARIGMQVERSGSLATRRLLAVAEGEAQFSTLNPGERTAAHAVIDAQIAMRVAQQRFGPDARTAGQTTVSIDDDGKLIEIGPDGSRRYL
jgi:ParD-like antitoxin of type II bacterial toxin-antitoxin system